MRTLAIAALALLSACSSGGPCKDGSSTTGFWWNKTTTYTACDPAKCCGTCGDEEVACSCSGGCPCWKNPKHLKKVEAK